MDILRFEESMDIDIVFDKNDERKDQITSFIDSNYVRKLDKRRSIIYYIFLFVAALVSWKSTLQSNIVLSTIESEYMAVAEATKEAL